MLLKVNVFAPAYSFALGTVAGDFLLQICCRWSATRGTCRGGVKIAGKNTGFGAREDSTGIMLDVPVQSRWERAAFTVAGTLSLPPKIALQAHGCSA